MRGKLYGVGVGPGDPELVTCKAVRLITQTDCIAIPKTAQDKDSMALGIVQQWVTADKEILPLIFPMRFEQDVLEQGWAVAVATVQERLDSGRDVVFLTIGDPTVYSTYLYLHKRLVALGYIAEIVPGVTSFCASAAAAGISLVENKESFAVLPSAYGVHDVAKMLTLHDNVVLMKAAKHIAELKPILKDYDTVVVSNCGLPTERIVTDLDTFDADEGGYFTTVIVKKRGEKR